MRGFCQDVRFGLRLLRSSPGFTAVAVLTLALGIGASTTVYAWIDGMVLHPFSGVQDGDRLAILETVLGNGGTEDANVAFADFRDFRQNLTLLSGLALRRQEPATVGEGEHARRSWWEVVSGNYFAVLGVKPVLGRVFRPEEYSDTPGAYVAVISYRLWQNMFRADPGVLGKTIRVNRQQATVIGVAPPDFRGATPGLAFDGWVPLVRPAELDRGTRHFGAIARLKLGVTIAQAHAEVQAAARQLARTYPATNAERSARLVPVWKARWGASDILLAPLRILAAACAIVLLIACANVSNLLLARSAARQREFGIRAALGAGRGRLVRQYLTESLLLAGLATLVSLLLVGWTANALIYFIPPTGLPAWFAVPLKGRTFGFAALICLATAMAAGLPPVLHSLRANLNDVLKQGGRSEAAGAGSHRLGALLVVSEVGLALVALIGAGLFLASFRSLRSTYPGFDSANVLASRLYLSTSNYSVAQEKQFCLRLRDRLVASPGTVAVSYADTIPLGFEGAGWDAVQVDGYTSSVGENMNVYRSAVAPGYFELLRIPLLAGRDFTRGDNDGTPRVMIVNQSFARRYFHGRDPIGRRVVREGVPYTVVGMARDCKYGRLAETPQPFFYLPFEQGEGASGNAGVAFYVRTTGDPRGAIPVLRREMAAIDPDTCGFAAAPLAESMGAAWFGPKLATTLLSVLAAIALLLAAVGLYGVMAYAVSRRTQEIGLRMALGARPRDVLGNVLRRGMALTAAGLAAGTAAAFALTRLVASMLVNVGAADPATFCGAALFLALVALLACCLPARRACKVDPMAALRCQ